MGWLALAILMIAGIIGLSVLRSRHAVKLERMRVNGKKQGLGTEEIERLIDAEAFPMPTWTRPVLGGLAALFLAFAGWNQLFFYAEPGFVYHVRTIAGQERVIDSVGYAYHLFGRINNWKKAMTVQAVAYTDSDGDGRPDITSEGEGGVNASATMTPLSVVMLDQVDSKLSATTRFRIPTDREAFLRMAHEYRTPENLLRTALVPAFKETLQATGSLMAAEEYYSGRRTEFNAEFENQMQNGIYLVTRHQITVEDPTAIAPASADGSTSGSPDLQTGGKKTKWVVEKKMKDGVPVRKTQAFVNFGITVVEARVTDLVPNNKFVERMQLKQQAAADRAIAQEKRVQEEEQKLLAIARGEREVAEEQALAKKAQIKQTTEAETDKRLALIAASKQLEQAEIDKQTAQIQKEKADIDAEKIKVLADADKYEREARIAGDNALQQKLDAEVAIQAKWAEAYARRAVPQQVFVTGGTAGDVPQGGDQEVKTFLNIMTMDSAKRLAYDRGIPQMSSVK